MTARDKNDVLTLIKNNLLPYFLLAANCMTVGTVAKLNGSTADVQPTPLQSDGDKRPIIGNCLVTQQAAEYRKDGKDVHLKKGDVVLVGFLDRDMDNFNGSRPFSLASRRMHSVNDAVVIGVIAE
ncbi:hypothetical protein [Lactobacillus brevis] [Lactiplantibacillus mudanjiangensis]|uniref:hypothetical protein n=1 Tax=Lactiplantibacillus mudanjiangensis TaxID=1296538 RepID=UPI001014A40C|nr:hypothetical protein [Lactobacillus brevis] [Lactiplantibacillus mudanjiangensis]